MSYSKMNFVLPFFYVVFSLLLAKFIYNIIMKITWDVILDFIKNFGTNVLEAIALLLFGIIVIRGVVAIFRAMLRRTKVDNSAASFILSLIKAALGLWLFFIIMNIFNIDTSSVVAVVAASGLAVGLALQDSLSNIACGIIILFTKPFKENDYVSINGFEGSIKKIKITTTELLSYDNISIIIPNAKVVNSELMNYSQRSTRRIDLFVNVAYESDIEKVEAVLRKLISDEPKALDLPAPDVNIDSLASSAITFKIKFWVNTPDFWDVKNAFYAKIIVAFRDNGIEIPYNHLRLLGDKETKND